MKINQWENSGMLFKGVNGVSVFVCFVGCFHLTKDGVCLFFIFIFYFRFEMKRETQERKNEKKNEKC